MGRQRQGSNVSNSSTGPEQAWLTILFRCTGLILDEQKELDSMYDYLAKVILLGPSGSGKSCLLHRIVKKEWRIISSQTIGVEFSSRIIKVGSGSRRKRIKLQLWDTAGTERFRSVSRSYYRGAAGAILIYDVASRISFEALPTFLNDARALASPNLTLLLAGNKADLAFHPSTNNGAAPCTSCSPLSTSSQQPASQADSSGRTPSKYGSSIEEYGLNSRLTVTLAPDGQEVSHDEASRWASNASISVAVEVSAYTGDGVEELFTRLASIILTKIELGDIDPDDPMSGIQYGDSTGWGNDGSARPARAINERGGLGKRKKDSQGRAARSGTSWGAGVREWDSVFRVDGLGRQKRSGCC